MPTTDLQVSPKRAAIAAVVFSNILWGSSFLFGKWALEEWPSSYVVLGRFAIAAALLAPALRRGRLEKGDLKWVLLGGFLMAPVMMGLQFEGLDRTTATSAALIIGTIPVLLTIAGILFEGERPGWKTWAAILASTAGAALLVGTPGEGRGLVGDVLVFASAVAAVAWIMVVRQLMRRHDALYVTALNI
ncbi:MAG: DMT family transporter, partial [Bacteroidota bacterium]